MPNIVESEHHVAFKYSFYLKQNTSSKYLFYIMIVHANLANKNCEETPLSSMCVLWKAFKTPGLSDDCYLALLRGTVLNANSTAQPPAD
jgi:hypothetical protein